MSKSVSSTNTRFTGFQAPNTTPVPDELFDELLTALSGSELKVLLYIIRRTFGFKKTTDTISLKQMLHGITRKDGTQLDRGVGIKSKTTLLRVLKGLERKNTIVRQRRSNRERGHLPTAYSLNVAGDSQASNGVGGLGTKIAPTPGTINAPSLEPKINPTTRNRFTRNRFTNNVGKKPDKKKIPRDKAHVDYLIDEVEKATDDRRSRGGFAQAVASTEDHKVFQLISELKDAPNVRNKGAWFMARTNKNKSKANAP